MPYTPGQLLDGLQADLGSIPFGRVDGVGVAWTLQDMQGWDSTDVRSDLQQREGDHGAWQAPTYLVERPVSLSGTIVAPDRATLDDALERIRTAASITDTTLTVYESIPKQATVRRSGKTLLQYVTDTLASYSVMVTAPDPRRYATELQSGTTMLPSSSGGLTLPYTLPYTISAVVVAGQIDALNSGSFETRPLLKIDGPVSQPQILALMPDGSVRVLAYSQDLATGEQLVIDTDTHSVILNGQASRRRFMSAIGPWPVIPPGETVSFQFRGATYNPTGMLTAQWRSAWN